MARTGQPIYGLDAAGQDAYAEIIASPRGSGDEENKEYNNIYVWCATKDAILSLDGGTTDNVYVGAGKEPMKIEGVKITQAIQAKNAAAGQNYATLVVIAW